MYFLRLQKKAILDGVAEDSDTDWEVLAMEGFIGMAPDGATTTLGRGGSDYTAALMAIAVGADHLGEIYRCYRYVDS